MIDPKQIEILHKIFNEGHELNNGMKISCKPPAEITVNCSDNTIDIDFKNNLPLATVKKFISLNLSVEGFTLKKDSGIVKIRHFPDINFDYEEQSKATKPYEIDSIDFSEINSEICDEYDDENRKKLAHKCLQYAKEWATIASYGGVSFENCTQGEQRKLKAQCSEFIKSSMKDDEEVRYGSIILTFILIQIILPIIIKWIVERVFRRLFK